MKELSFDGILSLGKAIFSSVSIGVISKYWTSYRGKMYTYLMGSTRFYSSLKKTIFIENIFLNGSIMGNSLLSCSINSHLCFIPSILDSKKFGAYCITRLRRISYYEGVVYFFYFSTLQKREKGIEHLLFFCYY